MINKKRKGVATNQDKQKSIASFFKISRTPPIVESSDALSSEERPSKISRIEIEEENEVKENEVKENDICSLERDPGVRPQIWDYPLNQQDEIRRGYIRAGPYQPILPQYPMSAKLNRRFQASWFKQFSTWLEYSPKKDAAYCLPCYVFNSKINGRHGWDTFTIKGFTNWKKVHNGVNCGFLTHMGSDHNSTHNKAVSSCVTLLNQSHHIDKVMISQSAQEIEKNRLRVKTSIDVAQWLAFQGCAFRGHDETTESTNRGNFLEMIKLLASYNTEVGNVVLENAPAIASYTSPAIQKQILHIIAIKVRKSIREDIGDSKYCIIVDEARDESKREQMALILRFVDKKGFIRERFFDIAHVENTSASTLKSEISSILSRYCLDIQNIRGQGYDGASNMRGEFKGLQALFLQDCPYAYFVHCFAHRLQLALVSASREVLCVHEFFSNLNFVVNTVTSSCKRNDELQNAKKDEVAKMIEIGELESGKGVNQASTLRRGCDTRWGSHFYSICSLIKLFKATCSVLESVIKDGSNYSIRGDAKVALKMITSFEFVFVLHSMEEIMGITDMLSQALQRKSQDILNALDLISSTKALIQKFREDGWNDLLQSVVTFSKTHNIIIPDLEAEYIPERGARRRKDTITVEHYFHYDILNAILDCQLQELGYRFSDHTVELLRLGSSLNPKDDYKSFNIEEICTLAQKYYPFDFIEHDRKILKYQLQHFQVEVAKHPKLKNLSSISELCQKLVETEKTKDYYLIDRLIRLILTLPVSTATSERAFSAMKIVKTRLCNRMEDDFLADNLVLYIERELAETFSSDSILDDFVDLKERRVRFR